MKILERLKLELNNQEYYTDIEYTQFLTENNLNPTLDYDKQLNQRDLLLTVLDILESISNDIDLMRKIADDSNGFTTENASKFLSERKSEIKAKIATLPAEQIEYSNVAPLIVRRW